MSIRIAQTDEEILSCFPIVSQLRPHLDRDRFLAQVRRQIDAGYHLAFLAVDGSPVTIAGFRILEKLSSGRVLYVDDLVTDSTARSEGYGARVLEWLKERAQREGCEYLQLDSGVQRLDAHRFYEREGLRHVAHHFDWPRP